MRKEWVERDIIITPEQQSKFRRYLRRVLECGQAADILQCCLGRDGEEDCELLTREYDGTVECAVEWNMYTHSCPGWRYALEDDEVLKAATFLWAEEMGIDGIMEGDIYMEEKDVVLTEEEVEEAPEVKALGEAMDKMYHGLAEVAGKCLEHAARRGANGFSNTATFETDCGTFKIVGQLTLSMECVGKDTEKDDG